MVVADDGSTPIFTTHAAAETFRQRHRLEGVTIWPMTREEWWSLRDNPHAAHPTMDTNGLTCELAREGN